MVTPSGEAIGPITGLLPSCMPAKSTWSPARRAENTGFHERRCGQKRPATELSFGWVTPEER
jgi:hypothetical protein